MCMCERVRVFVVRTTQLLVYYYAFSTVFNYMTTYYFCIGTFFIQGTDGYVDIAHLMKSEYAGPNLIHCVLLQNLFCRQNCSFLLPWRSSLLCYIIADTKERRPARPHTPIVRPTQLVLVSQH